MAEARPILKDGSPDGNMEEEEVIKFFPDLPIWV